METSANISKKCYPTPPVDIGVGIEDNCVFRENSEEWQELEQFWGDPRHRLLEFDSQTQQLSSSLERHLLFDECIQKPEDDLIAKPKDESFVDDADSLIRGEDINDIPTQYTITGFDANELIVIGSGTTMCYKNSSCCFPLKRGLRSDLYVRQSSPFYFEEISAHGPIT